MSAYPKPVPKQTGPSSQEEGHQQSTSIYPLSWWLDWACILVVLHKENGVFIFMGGGCLA